MRSISRLLIRFLVPGVAVLVLVSCGSGSDTAESSSTASTAASTSSSSSTMPGSDSVEFDLVIGENSGRDTMVEVRVGTTVTLNVTSDLDGDEVHIHGYDLYLDELLADEPASITFVADTAGTFEVESHETGEVVMVLRVT